jgi:hypothetical protein
LWDKGKIRFHNLKFEEIVYSRDGVEEYQEPRIEITPEPQVFIPPSPQVVIASVEPDPIPVEEPVAVETLPPKKQTVSNKTAKLLEKHKVVFHCLPVTVRKVSDDFYGSEYSRDVYGEKFTFPAILIEESDLMIQFWTDRELGERSIVYPMIETKRWWRVQSYEEKSGGYFYSALPSDINPDFGD